MKFKWHVLLLVAALQVCCASAMAQIQYQFTGGGDGYSWDDSYFGIQANWDPTALPDDSNADVWIPDGFAVVGNGFFTVGRLTIDRSSLAIQYGLTVQKGSFQGSGSIAVDGHITIDSGATLSNSGGDLAITGGGSITSAGTVDSAGGSTISVGVPLSMSGGTFAGNGAISTMDLTIGGSVAKTDSGPLVTDGSLTFNFGSTLDIGQAPYLIEGAGYDPAAVTALVASAYDNGKWDGHGITSNLAAAAPKTTGVAVGDNALLGLSSYDDQSIDANTLILAYTWLGDANLDGVVNSADLAMMKPTGTKNATWSMGDFNYDGVVNGDDYAMLMLGAAASGGANISATLPEASGGLLLVGCAMLVSVRRRRRRVGMPIKRCIDPNIA